jgi:Fe-S cluster assembly ATP-binding protein
MGILEVKDLSLSFDGTYILQNLSIDFWEGHVHAIVGPNGAGKSTLANTIMGLPEYRDHEGDILLEGSSLKGKEIDERAQLGITLAWQEPARFVGITVSQFIKASAKEPGQESVDKALREVGLDAAAYRNRAVDRTLSGGERKRIELASIIAMEPKIVLMDEPDSGVDTQAIDSIFSTIHNMKEKGTTTILITHSAEVLKQADHAFLLCHGFLMDKGTADKMSAYFEGKCIPCTHKNDPAEKELAS